MSESSEEEMIDVCPGCDRPRIYQRQKEETVKKDGARYVCRHGDCGKRFDEPAVRPRDAVSRIRGNTVASLLADPNVSDFDDLDPDAVREVLGA